ncbi:MAG: hypothetical protein OEY22_10790 [Candidatus Bathyarchaeota archaeon]|nr:hypothetical protein [Candidatus Bathyarchaeota archaeon]
MKLIEVGTARERTHKDPTFVGNVCARYSSKHKEYATRVKDSIGRAERGEL